MKKVFSLFTILFMMTATAVHAQNANMGSKGNLMDKAALDSTMQLLPWETPHDSTCHQVIIETNMGNILVALYNDTPKHRDNFLKLVNSGFYNGCIFQRVIKNFMI